MDEPREYSRFVSLLHASEAFDGWKAFLIHPTGDTLLILAPRRVRQDPLATRNWGKAVAAGDRLDPRPVATDDW